MKTSNGLNQVLFWKLYTVLLLFLSTFLLYYWWLVPGEEVTSFTVIVLQSGPLLINIVAWTWWFAIQYISIISRKHLPRYHEVGDEVSVSEFSHVLYREIRLSTYISVMIGFQVAFMGMISFFLSILAPRIAL